MGSSPGKGRSAVARRARGVRFGSELRRRMGRFVAMPESGLATAEYAIVTVAAAGFAGVLIAILKSSKVRQLLTDIITSALTVG